MLLANKSLQATRDGGFPRRQGYAGQASSAIADDEPRVPELRTFGGDAVDA